jgi:hypothetical protein
MRAAAAAGILASVLLVGARAGAVPPYALNNGPGDGTVDLGVNGYGQLGFDFGYRDYYDPVGIYVPAQPDTISESWLLIRTGAGAFSPLYDTAGAPTVAGTATSASSSFIDASSSLSFHLAQVLTPVWNGTSRIGTLLTQTYAIENPTASEISFDLARFVDADVNNPTDGGGRLFVNGLELMFETDTATGTASAPVGVAITGEGGTIPATGRYELARYPDLGNSLYTTGAIHDTVYHDGADADQILDAGMADDVEIALRNQFVLGPGQSDTYVTRTYWVSGDLPEPGLLAALGSGAAWLVVLRALRERRASSRWRRARHTGGSGV